MWSTYPEASTKDFNDFGLSTSLLSFADFNSIIFVFNFRVNDVCKRFDHICQFIEYLVIWIPVQSELNITILIIVQRNISTLCMWHTFIIFIWKSKNITIILWICHHDTGSVKGTILWQYMY